MRARRRCHLLQLLAWALSACPTLALAQTGASAPLLVKAVVFNEARALDREILQATAQAFLNRPLRQDDLEELRYRLNRLFAESGFISSGAVIERFDAEAGLLHIRLIDGQAPGLRVQGQGRLSERYLASRLARDDEVFNVRTLEDRFRLLSADPLLARLDVRVVPGQALGETVLAVDVQRAAPVEVTVFSHNQQAPSVGAVASGAELTLRNLTGWGDALTTTFSHNKGGNNGDLAWTLPLLAGRTLLHARASRSHASVVEEPLAQLDVDSVVRSAEVGLTHPLIDDATTRWHVGFTHADRRNSTTLGGEPYSFVAGDDTGTTRARSERLFQEWSHRAGPRVYALRTTFTVGRSSLPAPALLAEQPARHYRVLLAQGQVQWTLNDTGTQLLTRASGQYTDRRLLPLEQFSVGGRQTVRGYRENQLARDRGLAGSVELRHPWSWGESPWQRVTLAAFADAGAAANVGEPGGHLASVGLGALWQALGADAELFWGKALRKVPTPTSKDLQDHGLHFSLRWRAF